MNDPKQLRQDAADIINSPRKCCTMNANPTTKPRKNCAAAPKNNLNKRSRIHEQEKTRAQVPAQNQQGEPTPPKPVKKIVPAKAVAPPAPASNKPKPARLELPAPDQTLAAALDKCRALEIEPIFTTVDGVVYTVRPAPLFAIFNDKIKIRGFYPFYCANGKPDSPALTTIDGYSSPNTVDLFVTPEAALAAWQTQNAKFKNRGIPILALPHPQMPVSPEQTLQILRGDG